MCVFYAKVILIIDTTLRLWLVYINIVYKLDMVYTVQYVFIMANTYCNGAKFNINKHVDHT